MSRAALESPGAAIVAGVDDARSLAAQLGLAAPTMLAALATFGRHAQEDMAIEEMAELTVALMHLGRNRATSEQVRSELADVLIMTMQLAIEYGAAEVADEVSVKVGRLRDRIRARSRDLARKATP